jgi:hypothetical protein
MTHLPLPKPGDKIYVPSRCYIDRGQDDVLGGKATVIRVEEKTSGLPINRYFVQVLEHPGSSYNWIILAEEQEKLKAEFGDSVARPDPEYGDYEPSMGHQVEVLKHELSLVREEISKRSSEIDRLRRELREEKEARAQSEKQLREIVASPNSELAILRKENSRLKEKLHKVFRELIPEGATLQYRMWDDYKE